MCLPSSFPLKFEALQGPLLMVGPYRTLCMITSSFLAPPAALFPFKGLVNGDKKMKSNTVCGMDIGLIGHYGGLSKTDIVGRALLNR